MASSLLNMGSIKTACSANIVALDQSCAPSITCLLTDTANGPLLAIFLAKTVASSSAVPEGTTRLIKPNS